jgi:MFS family permease
MDPLQLRRVQRRTLGVLIVAQVLGGLGFGATISMGSLLFVDLSGTTALSGMASTMSTLGAAIIAVPLAAVAGRFGRRYSLGFGATLGMLGAATTLAAAFTGMVPLLFLGIALLGMGNAASLQARFAATDLAVPTHRGRDLSIVVWSTTVGAVIGPNLLQPGEEFGRSLGFPAYSGPFMLTFLTQLLVAIVILTALRPDPAVLARRLRDEDAASGIVAPSSAGLPRRFAVFAIVAAALSHAVMVSIMAMTPVHATLNGASLTVVGITISLHVAGMFGFSPLFGILADRIGRIRAILVGQGILVAGILCAGFGADTVGGVMVGLALVGLGWSASTIAAAALVTEATPTHLRTRVQGRNDLVMSLTGAAGGALAGPVLAVIGYEGLVLSSGALIVTVVALAIAVTRPRDEPLTTS